jgi:class 3 adenylate cyclase/tetratricopeptide (TPR) repeat protein
VNCASCGSQNPSRAKFCLECGGAFGPAPARDVESPPGRDPGDYTPRHLADKILRSKSALEGERKQVTVLFADVRHSMALAEDLDPEDWHAILDRFFQILTEGVHRFEGTVNQYTGDGIMALFGAPIAHEDHGQRACHAALWLRDELRRYAEELKRTRGIPFAVRMGLNSGEVVVGKIGDDLRMDYTAQGSTVGLAARLQELAEPGSVYLTEDTAELARGYFELRDLGSFELEGSRAPLRVHELQGLGRLRTRFDLSRARGLSPFVGRDDELAQLEAAFERASAGQGGVVSIVAEAGTGKSRLCHEFLESCRARGIRTSESHCLSHARAVPLLPIIETIRSYFELRDDDSQETCRNKIAGRMLRLSPDLAVDVPLMLDFLGVPDPGQPVPQMAPEERSREVGRVADAMGELRSRAGPFVYLVEDLHWVDPVSEQHLLQRVAANAEQRTLVLHTFRPEYTPAWQDEPFHQWLRLAPLEPRSCEALLEDLLGPEAASELSQPILSRSGGNPFFIEEIVLSLVESGALSGVPGAYRTLRPAEEIAIPGGVRAVLAARIDRLDERDKELLQCASVAGKSVPLTLLRAASDLPDSELEASLRRLAEAELLLLESAEPEHRYIFKHPLTQEVAYLSQLEANRRRVHASVARALEVRHAARLDEQAALLAHHWERAGELASAARWSFRAASWIGRTDMMQAKHRWQDVVRLAESEGSREMRALALKAASNLVGWGVRTEISLAEIEDIVRRCRVWAEELDDRRALAALLGAYGFGLHMLGDSVEAAIGVAEEAVAIASELDAEPQLQVRVDYQLGTIYGFSLRSQEALALYERALARDPGAVLSRMWRAFVLAQMGRFDESRTEMHRVLRETSQRGTALGMPIIHQYFADCARLSGDFDFARHQLDLMAERAESIGDTIGLQSLPYREGLLSLELGDAQSAAAQLSAAAKGITLAHTRRSLIAPLACALAMTGERDGARAKLREVSSFGPDVPSHRLDSLYYGAQAWIELGSPEDLDRAARELDEMELFVSQQGLHAYEPRIRIERARIACLRGDREAAGAQLEKALRHYRELHATGHVERLERLLQS